MCYNQINKIPNFILFYFDIKDKLPEIRIQKDIIMKRKLLLIVLSVSIALTLQMSAFAASTSEAKEPVDTSRTCSLSLIYSSEGKAFEGLEIEAFRFAEFTENYAFALCGAFADYPVVVNGIKAQSEWNALLSTMCAYITADDIEADYAGISDSEGKVSFTGLIPGIYIIRWTKNETSDNVTGFDPFLITLPGLNDDGMWKYDMTSLPKPGGIKEPAKEYRVTKLWKDDGVSDERPHDVEIWIYKNGEKSETVTLNALNNWTYCWETNEDAEWTVIEKGVSEKYKVTVETKDNTFIVTNSREGEPPLPPITGESSEIYIYFGIALAAGMILVLTGILRRRSEK